MKKLSWFVRAAVAGAGVAACGATFTDDILAARRDGDGAAAALARTYPAECAAFTNAFGISVAEFLRGGTLDKGVCEEFLYRHLEYAPMTSNQWGRLPAAEQEDWTRRLIALAAACTNDLPTRRPANINRQKNRFVFESVAPSPVPLTPLPRTYDWTHTEDEATREEWNRQLDGTKPANVRFELRRTRALAQRLGLDRAAELDKLEATLDEAERGKWSPGAFRTIYHKVRYAKRRIFFANPVLKDIRNILLVEAPLPMGSEAEHEARHKTGQMAVPGGQLLVKAGFYLDNNLRRLYPEPGMDGSFWRPDVSFDGKKVLFSFKPRNEKAFHIYEINADGTGLRQLTGGIFDDFDPIYLPDGTHYAFTSTRGHTFVRCGPSDNAFVLMRGSLDAADQDLYFISSNNEPDYLPSLLDDGRIVYTRWEYTDKPLWRAQGIWTVNPDGTQTSTYWGNQSVWPDILKDVRQIPGTPRLMFTGCGHHHWFRGAIGIVDPTKGNNYPDGLTKVTQELAWQESGDGPAEKPESADYYDYGYFSAYQSPYPLGGKDFLVCASREDKFALYLMDTDGNRELVYSGANSVLFAMPLAARPRPRVLTDRVTFPTRAERLAPKDGSFYTLNVYEGAPEELKGKIRWLRLLHIEPKTYTFWNHRDALSAGPNVSLVQTDGVKRILGEVPVNADGSVWFTAPAGVALHFQVLDEKHRALQTMRSFVSVQPGESRGCLGCHEQHSGTQAPTGSGAALLKGKPRTATPPVWAPTGDPAVRRTGVSIGFRRDIQPILDRACGACHQGEGKARAKLDLTADPAHWEPYALLIGYPGWGHTNHAWSVWTKDRIKTLNPTNLPAGYDLAGTLRVEHFGRFDPAAYVTPKPMTRLSYTSPLVKIVSGEAGHAGVKVSDEDLQKVVLWVDAMCPYLTDTDIRALADPQFDGCDWLAQKPRLKTAPRPVRPGPFSAFADEETVRREYNFPDE